MQKSALDYMISAKLVNKVYYEYYCSKSRVNNSNTQAKQEKNCYFYSINSIQRQKLADECLFLKSF
jgi:hypothetical protein